MEINFKSFTNKYQLSKTLRFELKPVGKTLEHIEAKGLLSEDEKRAESYKKMKKTIDGFHKYFIELAMSTVRLTHLEAFQALFNAPTEFKKEEAFKKELEKVQDKLRKEIVKGFSTGEAKEIYTKLGKKELITDLLEQWILRQSDDFYFDEGFKNFTTYFGGFHENRKNMYSDKAQSTAIAYRLIHENLPKFLENIKIFEKVKAVTEVYEKCQILYKEIEEYLNIAKIDKAFELNYYNEVLTQKQIDVYNLIIGGRTSEEGKRKIQGLNEYINLYNQKQEKNKRIPRLKPLYKQILSDRSSTSFMAKNFTEDQEVLDAIEEYYKFHLLDFKAESKDGTENVLEKVKELLANLKEYDLSKLYLKNDTKITNISQKIFGNYGVFNTALEYYYATVVKSDFQKEYDKANQKKRDTLDKAQTQFVKQPYVSIELLQKAIDAYIVTIDKEEETYKRYSRTCIADYFKYHFKAEKKEDSDKEFGLIDNINAKYSCIQGLLGTSFPKDKNLIQQKNEILNIKAFLDSLMELVHFVKPLTLPKDCVLEKDQNFYAQFEPWVQQLELLIPLYNKVRNYATQKPYSIEKFKLNFENSTLLDGWDVNKEESNTSILFIKNGNYYLGIMDKNQNKIFRNIPKPKTEDRFQKINYKLLPGASKMLPKVFFSNKNIAYYNPSDEILRIRNYSTHTKGGSPQSGFEKKDFNLKDCRKMIDFFKDSIEKHPEWKNFGFEFSSTENYDSIDAFYREVEFQGYNITYNPIDADFINQLVEEGKLYLFQIYNKDFSSYSKGKPNMHTMYWKALFDEENLKDVIYKLNGQAEVFFRKSSIDNPTVHKGNVAVANKNPLAEKKESLFDYDLIKDKRYTLNKFQFHVPITLNFKATGNNYINSEVLEFLQNNPGVNIIGLDRGERHLIYLTLINQKGEIILQESLNTITAENYPITTPYHSLLATKEKERDEARKSWGTIENIKELKEGYISQVVHKIAKLMVEYNAIVVMEDLNLGFKRGRFKVEKQVYQKLEKMLIDKLNYLVFKDKAPNETGGLYNALQLTNKFESFQKMGKQCGFLFYVPAWNTSKIDPTTGFVNLFDTRYENLDKAKVFFSKFEDIRYNGIENYFEFVVENYADFNAKAEGTKQGWTICSFGERIKTFRNPDALNQWDNQILNLTEAFKELFAQYQIDFKTEIKEQIAQQSEAKFFKSLLDLFKLTLQMRNSISNSEVDYLISPVKNSQGQFFDSRKADDSLPKDADANGAYHIAQKGLMWLEQINQYQGTDWKKLILDKANKSWLQYIQNKNK